MTGVGFQPKYLKIQQKVTADAQAVAIFYTSDVIIDDHVDGVAIFIDANQAESKTDLVQSLDADGFTVGDGGADSHPNKADVDYNYIAIA